MLREAIRIPLSWDQNARTTTFSRDAVRQNVMDEPGDGTMYTSKRPGTVNYAQLSVGNGQGLTWFNGVVYGVNNDVFTSAVVPPSTGTNGVSFVANGNAGWSDRGLLCALVFNDQVFVFGGVGSGTTENGDVWVTADMTNWVQVTGSAPFGSRQGMAACVFNGKMWVTGGLGNTTFACQQDVWSSPDGANWTLEIENCPWTPRCNHGMVATANGMFVIGGSDTPGAKLRDVWFSADGKNWTIVTTTAGFTARDQFGCCVFNNKLYVAGGAQPGLANDVWSSPDGAVWTQETVAAFSGGARFGLTLTVYAGKMWALAGSTGAATQEVYSSSTGTGAWTLVVAVSFMGARYSHAAVVFKTTHSVSTYRYPTLWVMGGINGATLRTNSYGLLNTAISSSTTLVSAINSQPFDFASFRTATQLLIKNDQHMWVMSEGVIQQVTTLGYPTDTVPGIVVLGGFAYVMDPTGLIHNCDLDNAFSWQSINVIGADYEDDQGIRLAKYLNYVVAFGTFTTQVFYDAGNPYGSPLVPYLNANSRFGCASAASVVDVGTSLAWVSQSRDLRRQVVFFNGLTPEAVSTPYIEEWLNASTSFSAFKVTAKGQLFYVVNCQPNDVTWAYSFTTKRWYPWRTSADTGMKFPGSAVDLDTAVQYYQAPSGGAVVYASDTAYDDSGVAFLVKLITQKVDGGNNRRKFFGRLDVIGDRNTSTPSIYYSDDDYQSWSAARTVDLSGDRPSLFRNGSARRRAYRYEQLDSAAMRLECLEQTLEHELG